MNEVSFSFTEHVNDILSKLKIDGTLYDIHDPCVDELASQVETAINNLIAEIPVLPDYTDSGSGPVTSVNQTDGQITVTHGNIASSNVNSSSQNYSNISTVADHLTALENAIGAITGVSPELLASLEKIIAEIEGDDTSSAANAWITLVDKLKGLDTLYTAAEANAHNAELTGALNSTDALSVGEAEAYNEVITGANKSAGDTLSEAEANLYNSTLEGAISEGTVKASKTVKQYVDNAIAALNAIKANKDAITTGSVNNWTTSYDSETATLEWTSTSTPVYVPVTGKSL